MPKSIHLVGTVVAAAALCGAAVAQTAPTQPTGPTAPKATPPATQAKQSPAATFTDDQLKSFVKAQEEVTRLRSSSQAPPSAQELAATVQKHGLDAATFNAIGRASRDDPALAQRIAEIKARSDGAS
jgi:hypothetical protein